MVYLILGVVILGTAGFLMDSRNGFIPGMLIGLLAATVLDWHWPVQPLLVARWADVPVAERPNPEMLGSCIRRYRQPHIVMLGGIPVLAVVLGYLLAHQFASQIVFSLGSDAIAGLLFGFGCTYGLIRAAECLQVRAALDARE